MALAICRKWDRSTLADWISRKSLNDLLLVASLAFAMTTRMRWRKVCQSARKRWRTRISFVNHQRTFVILLLREIRMICWAENRDTSRTDSELIGRSWSKCFKVTVLNSWIRALCPMCSEVNSTVFIGEFLDHWLSRYFICIIGLMESIYPF